MYDEEKRQGILINYTEATKSTTDTRDDWSVALTLTYPNWAALDSLPSRTDPITLAHYGSAGAQTAAGTARLEHGMTVSSILVRDQTVSPWK